MGEASFTEFTYTLNKPYFSLFYNRSYCKFYFFIRGQEMLKHILHWSYIGFFIIIVILSLAKYTWKEAKNEEENIQEWSICDIFCNRTLQTARGRKAIYSIANHWVTSERFLCVFQCWWPPLCNVFGQDCGLWTQSGWWHFNTWGLTFSGTGSDGNHRLFLTSDYGRH